MKKLSEEEIELKLCPFCQGNASTPVNETPTKRPSWVIRCETWFCIRMQSSTKKDVISRWNGRPIEDILQAERDSEAKRAEEVGVEILELNLAAKKVAEENITLTKRAKKAEDRAHDLANEAQRYLTRAEVAEAERDKEIRRAQKEIARRCLPDMDAEEYITYLKTQLSEIVSAAKEFKKYTEVINLPLPVLKYNINDIINKIEEGSNENSNVIKITDK